MRIIILGTGHASDVYLQTFPDIEPNTVGYLITIPNSIKEYQGKPVYSLEDLLKIDYDEIHIANQHYSTVIQLLEHGISKDKIVLCHIELVKEYIKIHRKLDIKCNLTAVLTNKCFHSVIPGDEPFFFNQHRLIINSDYCRAGTLHLLAEEITKRNIGGNCAELGVYRGDFARLINLELPERMLYLFDTFQGFSEEQTNFNVVKGYCSEQDITNTNFEDTSVQIVVSKMPSPQKVKIIKGLFPQSLPQQMDSLKYALVSLDCDLYEPILAGLNYFYPRLSTGGYIMIHDYNSPKFFAGVQKALDEYERQEQIHIPKVPLPDHDGTIILTK